MMGMAWPWKRHPHSISLRRWLTPRWFALLDQEPPPTAAHVPPTYQAAAQAHSDPRIAEFEAFFLRFDRQITAYLWRMTGDEQIASELAQETFLRAWLNFDTISHYEQPLGWLFHVATNLARQHHRRHTVPPLATTAFNESDEPASSDPSVRFAEQELVRQTLLQLPIHQRAALILREVYGFSCAEVGHLLNISRDAVKMSLWRAREQFRTRYLREEEES